MKTLFYIACILCLFTAACSDGKDEIGSTAAPQALAVNVIVNPSQSGAVTFIASAINASTYRFDYGDNNSTVVSSGNTTHMYAESGTYNVIVTAINSADSTTKNLTVKVDVAGQSQRLLFSDEFNVAGAPDPNKWTFDIGMGDWGWGNGESQYYTNRPENVIAEDGVLKIKAIREGFNGGTFTSARLKTQNRFSFTYGKVEIRAKLPKGAGTWAAAWMLGANHSVVGWPECGEIDILEYVGNQPSKVHSTLHYPGRYGGNANGASLTLNNATEEFHVYLLDWSETAIKIFVDDALIHSVPNSASIPFNHDFFIILNLAMGGTFGGNIDPTLNNATFEIDYVRVYAQ